MIAGVLASHQQELQALESKYTKQITEVQSANRAYII
jgi:hypothetical protein